MAEIFIASTSVDSPTYAPVVSELDKMGHVVTVYSADKIATGEERLLITVNRTGKLTYELRGQTFNPETVDAAWYRHPNLFCLDIGDKATELSVGQEMSDLQQVLLEDIPTSVWLNSPERIRKAQNKLAQLSLATTFGLSTPKTMVTNSWQDVEREFSETDLIVKMSKGTLYNEHTTKGFYTTRLTSESREKIKDANPFPGIYQPYIEKKREWRVTVIGDSLFAAAIYTSEDAKDDWRKLQKDCNKVLFVKEELPEELQERCIKYTSALGLRYAALDFIEDPEGEVFFLEINPNGQYMFLEKELGFPISQLIAGELAKIALFGG